MLIQKLAQINVECITGDEGENFFFTDDVINDLLSIISVHPIREDVINQLLKDKNLDRLIINKLIEQNVIEEFLYENNKFYRRRICKKTV